VFGNYQPPAVVVSPGTEGLEPPADAPSFPETLQSGIDEAMARTFLYRFLAQLFDYPDASPWSWLGDPLTHRAVLAAAQTAGETGDPGLVRSAADALAVITPGHLGPLTDHYIAAFGHGARGSCPINEIEYGDLRADPLFQPHRLADLGAFYSAFGLRLTGDGGERQDHLCVELEFMAILALREAHALEHQLGQDEWLLNREAETRFLREHLGRWTPAFARRVRTVLGDSPWTTCATLLRAFVEGDCRRLGVRPGSEDLLLRPVDETAESMCASCGVPALPPGATST
jgi:DMSO reductase family type II enzyme chaperone